MSQKRLFAKEAESGDEQDCVQKKKPKRNGSDEGEEGNDNIDFGVDEQDQQYVQGPLDPLFGQHRAFPIDIDIDAIVASGGNSGNSGEFPKDVHTYLAMVRLEAEKSDGFMFTKNETKSIDNTCDSDLKEIEFKDSNSNFKEFEAWRGEAVEKYTFLKIKFNSKKIQDKFSMPQDKLLNLMPSSVKDWKAMVTGQNPNLQILYNLDLSYKFKLINYFQRWLNRSINKFFIKWVFTLLLLIPSLLDYSNMAILRSLAKKSKKLLEFVTNKETKVLMDWIVTIAAQVYGQKDLLL
ncbi:hypothetical protein PACTADRAFT_34427 [Pachysolen tannophilus NRRL Y-2460]|uniref:Uncharacterized protein n=1 Tax=Pachysolen tannophilus NRRL Y-2460 TaxID=669874 RepID=A0A1E4TSG0_PACTA|nr:hypothetical protein PACTADRAFT_34427 [Pachysolen tannophilus NRRL Y-2460]